MRLGDDVKLPIIKYIGGHIMTIKQIKTVNLTATTASKIRTIMNSNGYDYAVETLAYMIIKSGNVEKAIAVAQAKELIAKIA